MTQVEIARHAAERFFDAHPRLARPPAATTRPQAGRRSDSIRVRQPNIVPDILSEEMKKLGHAPRRRSPTSLDEEQKIEFTSAGRSLPRLAPGLEAMARPGAGRPGLLGRTSSRPTPRIELVSAPIEVGPALREQLYRQGADGHHDQRHAQRRRPGRLSPFPAPARSGRLRRRCSSAARSTTASRSNCTCSARCPTRRPTRQATRRPCWRKIPEYVERTQGPGLRAVHQLSDACRGRRTRLRPWCAGQGLSAAQPERRPAADADGRAVPRQRATRCCSASIASGRAWMCRARRCRTSSSPSCRSRCRIGR